MRLVIPRTELAEVSDALFALQAAGIQEDWLPGEAPPPRQPWDTGPAAPEPDRVLLKAWWPDALIDGARTGVARAVAGWPGIRAPEWGTVADEDWAEAWKAGFSRIVVSEQLVVAPPWAAEPGDLIIEPGMAFGTGEHPTTLACLAAVSRLAAPGGRCLDVGCGTGVLALAAARQGMDAYGVDIDADAIRAARENAAANGLAVLFDDTDVADVEGTWDLVVANLFAEVLVGMAPALVRLCGGRLVLAGVLLDRAHLVEAELTDLTLVERQIDGDWVCLEYQA
jgi:ribosomal protein L11 methyltransferase